MNQLFANGNVRLGGGPTPDTNLHYYGATGTGTLSTLYDGSTLIASNAGGVASPSGLTLGGPGGGGASTEYSKGDIGELLIFNRVLSASEQAEVYAYLTGKWGSGGSIIPDTGTVTIAPGATLDANGVSEVIGSLDGSGSILLGSLGSGSFVVTQTTPATFSGIISGANRLTKRGSATLTLTGSNTYTGSTTIAEGTLLITTPTGLGTEAGGTTIADGATLAISGGMTVAEPFTLAANSATDAIVNLDGDNTLTGNITAVGPYAGAGLTTGFITGGDINEGVDLEGTFPYLIDVGATTGPIVRGKQFTGTEGAGTPGATLVANQSAFNYNTALNLGNSTDDNALENALISIDYSSNTNLTLDLANVVPGRYYKLQLMFSDQRQDGGRRFDVFVEGTKIVANTTSSTANSTSQSLIITYSFLATDTTLNIILSPNTGFTNLDVNTLLSVATLEDLGTDVSEGFRADSGTLTLAGNVTLVSGGRFSGSGDIIVTGNISETGGPATITKSGSSTLTLSGTNSFTGKANVLNGTLTIQNGSALSDTASLTLAAGTTLNVSGNETIGSLTGTGAVTLADTATLSVGQDNSSSTYSGIASGLGGLTKVGTGTFTLANDNTYSGITTISQGTLRLTAGFNAIPDTSNVVVNGTLNLNGVNESMGTLDGTGIVTSTAVGTATLTTVGGSFSGSLQNGTSTQILALTKTGTGTLILTGSNTYSGATTITEGTLQIGDGGTTGSLGATSVNVSGTFAINRSDTFDLTTFITGTGSLNQIGTGTTRLFVPALHTGGTNVLAGTFRLVRATLTVTDQLQTWFDATNAASLVVDGNGFVSEWKNISPFSNVANTNNLAQATGSRQPLVVANAIGNLPVVRFDGNDFLANTYNPGNVYSIFSVSKMTGTQNFRLITANLNNWLMGYWDGSMNNMFNGNWLPGGPGSTPANTNLNFFNAVTNTTGSLTTLSNGNTLITSGAGGSQGPNGLSLGGWLANEASRGDVAEILLFNRSLTPSEISSVNLYLSSKWSSAGNLLADTSTITVAGGATFDMNDFTETIGGIAGAGSITLGVDPTKTLTINSTTATTFSGVISGAGNVIKTGTGTQTLAGANTYTGATTISAGMLVAANDAALGDITTGTTVANGGTLGISDNASVGISLAEPITIAANSTTDAIVNVSGNNIITSNITASGPYQGIDANVGFITGGDLGEGVDLEGNFLYLVDVGATTPPPPSVRGRQFTGTEGAGTPGVTLVATSDAFNYTSVELGNTADDNAMETVLRSIDYSFLGDLTLDLADLVPGNWYKLQLLFSDASLVGNRRFDIEVEGVTIAADYTTSITNSGTRGSIVAYTLQATDTVLNIVLDKDTGLPNIDPSPLLSGVTLEDLGTSTPVFPSEGIRADAGTLTLSGTLTFISGGRLTGSGDIVVSGVVAQTGGTAQLTKSGSGTLTLAGANTYSGTSTLTAGTLIVANTTGSATGTNTLSTAAGSTLSSSATGSITGSVDAAGNITPGGATTIGTLTLGSTTLAATSISSFDITNTTTLDQIIVNGALTVSTGAIVQVPTGLTAGTYPLFTFTSSTATAGDFVLQTLAGAAAPGDYSLEVTSTAVNLIVIAPPVIVTSPSDTTVVYGNNITLVSTATGSTSVIWQFSTTGNSNDFTDLTANPSTFTAGVTSSNLDINRPSVSGGVAYSGLYYRAAYTNAAGTVYSTAAQITVTPKALTVSLTADDKTYDGTTDIIISNPPVLSGIVGSDDVSVLDVVGNFATPAPGVAKPVTITSVTLTGPQSANYTATLPTNVTATITPLNPVINNYTPNTGTIAGGTEVIFNGSNLTAAAITFDGIAASFVSSGSGTITVTTPAHAAGAVDIVITTPGGSLTLANGFTYVGGGATLNSVTANGVLSSFNNATTTYGPVSLADATTSSGFYTFSRIVSLELTFSDIVHVDDGAFTLYVGDIISPTYSLTNNAAADIITLGEGTSTIQLSFTNANVDGLEGTSLQNGIWKLRVDYTKIRVGAANGPAAGTQTDFEWNQQIRRLFGDANGDGNVGPGDFTAFGTVYTLQDTDPDFNPLFNSNNNSSIDPGDFTAFGTNFGQSL